MQILKKLKDVIGNPFSIDLKKFARPPDYEAKLAFIERFHEDFEDVVKVYAGKRRYCVFIDDLDRCEAPKSADLIQALNLMIPDTRSLYFVIGMDRDKVAAAVAVKHEKILPYLAPATAPASDPKSGFDASAGLSYGYAFLEKFIQIPFRMPQPTRSGVETLLSRLSGAPANAAGAAPLPEPPESRPRIPTAAEIGDLKRRLHEDERGIALLVAPALDYNPRRIKQFLNSFHLKTYISFLIDVLGPVDSPAPPGRYTLPQIGKFVAIGIRWPRLYADLEKDRRLLGKLQFIALVGRESMGSSLGVSAFERVLQVLGMPRDDLEEWQLPHGFDGLVAELKATVPSPLGRWAKEDALLALLLAGCLKEEATNNGAQGPPLPALDLRAVGINGRDLRKLHSRPLEPLR